MAYDRNKIFEQAKDVIVKHKLFFVEDIVAFIPISKQTFYDFFPVDSDELDTLKALLEQNRTEIKVAMRSKWYKSENPTLQIGLMKLIASPEEHKRLTQNYVESENKTSLNIDVISKEEIKKINDNLEESY